MKKKLAVAVGVTNDLVFSAAVVFENFLRIHPDLEADFVLFTDRISPRDEIILRDKYNARIELFTPPLERRFLHSLPAVRYFSELVLSKFEAVELLTDYKNVIWLDTDIVILRPLLATNAHDFAADISYVPNTAPQSNALRMDNGVLSKTKPGMSAGLIFWNDSVLSKIPDTSQFYEFVKNEGPNLKLPEQAAFDFVFNKFKSLKVQLLREEELCVFPGEQTPETKVIHAWGPSKFWNGKYFAEWQELYELWLSYGGSGYSLMQSRLAKLKRYFKYLSSTATLTVSRIFR